MTVNERPSTTFSSTDMNWKNYANYEFEEDWTAEKIGNMIVYSIAAVICLFGVFANGTVLYYLGFRIRRSPFTTYILSLAIADFIFLLISAFTVAFLNLHGDVAIGMSQMSSLLELFFLFGYTTSLYFLTAISLERSLSVLFPIWYQCRRPKRQSAIVCTVIWTLSGVVCAAYFISCTHYEKCEAISIIQAVISFLILLPLMVLSNMILVTQICRRTHRKHPPRLYILIITTMFAFLVLSLPLSLMIFLEVFDIDFGGYTITALVSPIINSGLNPVIYFLVGSLRQRQRKCSIIGSLRRAFVDESYFSQQ